MPIFEYVCEKCGNTFEKLVFRQDEPVSCPKCGDADPKKLVSAARVIGTGSGACAPSSGGFS